MEFLESVGCFLSSICYVFACLLSQATRFTQTLLLHLFGRRFRHRTQVLASPCVVGQVMRVRVLGCLALVDDHETDWKVGCGR